MQSPRRQTVIWEQPGEGWGLGGAGKMGDIYDTVNYKKIKEQNS